MIRDRPNRTIYINQTSYAKRVIAQADMESYYPAPDNYVADRNKAQVYRALVRELQWLSTMTRPDLAFAVGISGHYSINPTSEHLNSVKRIIKYSSGTTEVGLRYGPGEVTKGSIQKATCSTSVFRKCSVCVRCFNERLTHDNRQVHRHEQACCPSNERIVQHLGRYYPHVSMYDRVPTGNVRHRPDDRRVMNIV